MVGADQKLAQADQTHYRLAAISHIPLKPLCGIILLILIGLIMFTPFILAMIGTFKTDLEITAFPPKVSSRRMALGQLVEGLEYRSRSGRHFPALVV